MVAATIRKIHAPNHEAAVLLVSGSPELNLLYTFTPPINPTTAPIAYMSLVAGSKYDVTMFVASLMPAEPSCAKAPVTARIKAAEKNNLFFVIMIFE